MPRYKVNVKFSRLNVKGDLEKSEREGTATAPTAEEAKAKYLARVKANEPDFKRLKKVTVTLMSLLLLLLSVPAFAMNVQEAVSNIESSEGFVQFVGGVQPAGSEQNIPIYRQSYLVRVGDEAIVKSADFFVLNEGTETEEALYKMGMAPKKAEIAVEA